MPTVTKKSILCSIFCAVGTVSCSPSDDTSNGRTPAAQVRQISEEDRIAARALSVADQQTVERASSAYDRAVLCRHSVAVLAELFQNAEGLSDQQIKGLAQVERHFDSQLQALAQQTGKSASRVTEDLRKAGEANPNSAENARVAIACLRTLQSAG